MNSELGEAIKDIARSPEYIYIDTHITLVKNIESLMKSRGLDKDDLASKMNMNKQAVSRLLEKNSDPSLKTIARLAVALDSSVSGLLSENPH